MSGSLKLRATVSPSCSTTCALPERSRIWSLPRRYLPMTSGSRHGLGRGLGALLPPPAADSTGSHTKTPVDVIVPNPQPPRKDLNDKELHHPPAPRGRTGALQPVLVRRLGQGYQPVVGGGRWRAAKPAGLKKIPAI